MKPEALVIEDDAAQQTIFCHALTAAGYACHCIGDGGQALEYLQDRQPALIVLDLHLPGVDGEAIARQVKDWPHLAATRIILATADPRRADLLSPLSDLVLIKPVSYTQLRDLAARLLPPAA